MDILKAEILNKKKATNDIINNVNPTAKIGTTRFVRQADVKRIEDAKKAEAQRLLDQSRRSAIAPDSKADDVPSNVSEADAERSGLYDFSNLSVDQVKQRLRAIRQPITLFGEDNDERLKRLIRLQSEEQLDDDFRLGSGHNVSNSFLKNNQNSASADQDDEDDDDDDGDEGKVNDHSISQADKRRLLENIIYSEIKGLSQEKVIYKYFRSLLKRWEWDLNEREDRIKLTAKGKIETKTQKQCKDYIRPLFKFCKKKEVPEDICEHLYLMVQHCEQGNFRAAHDEYIKTAIGNAAWPIGLTMVGIHERSGREKISSSKVAHVMNNECQRKYLTSIKRLMTYAQSKRPDIPPSMKVT